MDMTLSTKPQRLSTDARTALKLGKEHVSTDWKIYDIQVFSHDGHTYILLEPAKRFQALRAVSEKVIR